MRAVEALPHRVERAGTDVAVDNAERGERERKELALTGAGGARSTPIPPTGLADWLEVGCPLPEERPGYAHIAGPP